MAYRISEAGKAAASPFLTQDQHGNPVLSWVQATDTAGSYLLYYAVSANSGQTFGAPKVIPTTKGVYPHDENLSKILYKKNGNMMVMFAVSNPSEENSYAGLVHYTQSFDGGKSWTVPKQLSESGASSIDERYFDMALLPNDDVAAVWLDSRTGMDTEKEGAGNAMQMHGDMGIHVDKEGSSLYYASTSGRGGFRGEKVIDRQLCQCCRTDLYIDEKSQLHVDYRGILNDSVRDMMHLVSVDNGKSFSKPERISPDSVTAVFPVIAPVSENRLLVAYTVKDSEAGEVWYQVVPVKE